MAHAFTHTCTQAVINRSLSLNAATTFAVGQLFESVADIMTFAANASRGMTFTWAKSFEEKTTKASSCAPDVELPGTTNNTIAKAAPKPVDAREKSTSDEVKTRRMQVALESGRSR